ncbi:MAG: hypothetical protein IJO86_04405 [Oscillospiraceae bacterium]|nr:hypothetical protein [Oscillospiraceae bacterium]
MAENTQNTTPSFLEYKGRPLVRSGNTIYYGNLYEEYVVMMRIINTTTQNGEEVPDKLSLQLIKTDPTISPIEAIVKKADMHGLYNAVDTASIWLETYLGAK